MWKGKTAKQRCCGATTSRELTRMSCLGTIKTHLPRHLLGYRQEAAGVDPLETSKLGWIRGQTYTDTYALALPKRF
ncbi:hypothetical protein K438DRAFT_1836487 [Mycena galopus ATCC 62051]|nr:hypothetical protein K438DRAFT_1836487 [Mycena galopus ATCC 62051]